MYIKKPPIPLLGLIYCMLYVTIHKAYCETYTEFLASTLPTLCPYSTFCTFGPTKQFKSKKSTPCCKPCSCDDDCLAKGNCCPDFTAVPESTSPLIPTTLCSVPVHYGYDGFDNELASKSDRYPHYYITSACPAEFSDHNVVRRCTRPDTLELTDRVMVSDDRGRTFSSRYCAECNNVQEFTVWDLKLMCKTFSRQLTNLNTLQHLNESGCLLFSSPPTAAIASASRCYPVENHDCNVTGRWRTYDVHIEQACRSTTLPFLKQEFGLTHVYANPYCFRCNEDLEATMTNKCPLDNEQSRQDGLPSHFSAMLDLKTKIPREHSGATKRKCDSSQIFDVHFGKCRQLFCPITLVASNGKCIKAFKEVTGLPFFIQIKVAYGNIETRTFFTTAFHGPWTLLRHFSDIAMHVAVAIGIREYSCDLCPGRALQRSDNSEAVFILGFRTNAKCSPSVLTRLLYRWTLGPRRTSMYITSQYLTFDLQMIYDTGILMGAFEPTLEFPTKVAILLDQNLCIFPFEFLQPKFHCAYVDIPLKDYKELLLTNKRHLLPSDFVVVDHGRNAGNQSVSYYRICVDKYLENKNTGVTLKLNWLVQCAVLLTGLRFPKFCW